jgi:TolB-like protein
MKLKYLCAVAAILAMVCACASAGKSGAANLDAAIQQASNDINDTLPAGTKVALLNFTSGSDVLSDYVLEEMSIALVKGRKLVVVDRKEIDLIRSEKNFQWSGEVSDESAQEIGKMLGAQSIVSGSLVNMGETHRFRTKVINVISAAIETSSSISVADDSQLQFLLSQGKGSAPQTAQSGTRAVPAQAGTSNQAQSATPATPAPAPAEPALPAYKIGDTGPAGGLIFYDKGNNSSGWRYLEAGPVDIEFIGVWSVRGTAVDNTQATIGSGKRNTQLAVEKFKQTTGEWDSAPQKVVELSFNGFNDWFIPSRDELDQMYGNLKRKNLGDFKNGWYMASSIYSNTLFSGTILTDCQNFSDGEIYKYRGTTYTKIYVRPIRQVAGPAR